MNKQTQFVVDVIERTNQGKMLWENVATQQYANFIIDAGFVFQAFMATFEKAKKKFTVLLIHKKVPTVHEELEVVHDNVSSEILVIGENRLIATIDQYQVEDMHFVALVEAVQGHNSDSSELFNGYEEDDYDFLK